MAEQFQRALDDELLVGDDYALEEDGVAAVVEEEAPQLVRPRPSARLIGGSAALAILAVLATVPATLAAEPASSEMFADYLANPEVLEQPEKKPVANATLGGAPELDFSAVAPSGAGESADGSGEAGATDGEAWDDLPAADLIVSEGAGYASADSLLLAISPNLLAALGAGADDTAMTSWIENAFSFMPGTVPAGWATEEGLASTAELAAALTDTEATELATYVSGGILQLKPGARCGSNDQADIASRLRALGLTRAVDEVYRVTVLTSEYPEGQEASLNPQGLYEQKTPYLAVRCEDAWYFYAPSFVMR